MDSDCVFTSKPATVAFPEVGSSSPQRIRMVVDLPAPFGPRKPKISPRLDLERYVIHGNKIPERLYKPVHHYGSSVRLHDLHPPGGRGR